MALHILPAAVRTAAYHERSCVTARKAFLSCSWCTAPPPPVREAYLYDRRLSSAQKCSFATEVTGDAQNSNNTSGAVTPRRYASQEADAASSPPTPGDHSQLNIDKLVPGEKSHLMRTLRQRLRQRSSRIRPRLRRQIANASESKDAVSALRALVRRGQQTSTGEETKDKDDNKDSGVEPSNADTPTQLIDLEYVEAHMPLPKTGEYRNPLEHTYGLAQTASMIHNICQMRGLPMRANAVFAMKEGWSTGIAWRCHLSVEVADLCQESAVGEGLNKATAQQLSLIHI